MQIPKISRKHYLVAVVILVVIAVFFIQKKATQVEYEDYIVSTNNIQDTLELSGRVVAGNYAILRFGLGGYVTYLGAQEGDTISKWQTLASIDTRQLKKVLDQKLNLYAIARNTFDQTIDDNDNSVPDGDLANTLKRILANNQYQLENTVLDVEYQDLTIKLARLTSPISGILTHSPITTANVQVAATDTWTVVDPDSLEFTADLDETDLNRVLEDQLVKIELDAFPDETISSTVSSISYSPKETTTGTTYEVKVMLPESDLAKLRLGLNGTANIILQEKSDVPTLPVSALTLLDGSTAVIVKKEGEYLKQAIKTGIENGGLVEILSGLEVGQHVYVEK